MQWHDVAQNTEEWFAMRVGKIGGSSIGSIMANYGKAFGEPAKKLAAKLAIERVTGISHENSYTNVHMERGHEQEPIARFLYESTYFVDVTNGGYFSEGNIGVSPDGLVHDNGVIEIKSVLSHIQMKTIKRNKYDSSYKWQLFFNLKVAEREWIDYVSFCAEFPEGKRLFVYRLYSKDLQEEFDKIDLRLTLFEKLVDENVNLINSYGG